ncbi:MAG: hypothetical protein ACKOX6_16295 [Bdellovibrio sp.]
MKIRMFALIAAVGTLAACSQESKVKSAVKSQFQEQVTAQYNKELKGSEKSKVWTDFKSLLSAKTSVDVAEVRIDGDNAEGVIKLTSLDDKTTQGLVMLLAFAAGDLDKKGMGLEAAWDELRKQDKRMPAFADYPIEIVDVQFKAVNKDGWKLTESKKVPKAKAK